MKTSSLIVIVAFILICVEFMIHAQAGPEITVIPRGQGIKDKSKRQDCLRNYADQDGLCPTTGNILKPILCAYL
jgi:hypothetical protein